MAKRTAMLGSLCAILVVLFHHWRDQKIRLAAGLASVVLLAIAAVSLSDALQTKFFQGIAELEGALAGKVSHESWNVRIQMARHTLDMIAEHPWTGWGIGSWNEQWRLRTSPEMAGYNMPHNDALWMGAQAGVLGGLSWLLLMTSGWSVAWKNRSWVGSAATAGICVATFSALINNATRDATIGLPMLWMMGVLVSLAKMPEPRP
jgi:O-antigen ligase